MLQPVPGPSNPAPPVILDPFINQAASLPSVCCQRMSLLPSPLKSPRKGATPNCNSSNRAIQLRSADIVTLPSEQSASPLQPAKREPANGAVSYTHLTLPTS